jgi:hypothetical protein
MSSSDTSNPAVTITNNSGVDVEIFDVYDPSADGQKGLYNYTSLGKLKNGERATLNTLHFASQLQAMYTGQVAALNNDYYENFPVAVLPVTILDDSTLSQTITADDRAGMEQAFLFVKYSGANADSNLTQQFVAALGKDDPNTAVDAFFKGTKNFSKASFAAWTSIMAWQTQFLSAWFGPYYLYQDDPNAKAIKLIAVANIVSGASESSAKLHMADQNGEVSASSQSTDIAQAGDGTINEKDVGTSPITATLMPVWMNIPSVQADGSARYAIGATMSGTVNGIKVLGNGQKITVPRGSGSGPTSWYDQFSKLYGLTLSTVGILSSMGMLFIMFKQWRGERTHKSNDVVNKSKNPKAEAESIEKAQKASDQQVDQEMRPKVQQQSQEATSQVEKLSATSKEITSATKEIQARQTLAEQSGKATEILKEMPPNDKFEQAVSALSESKVNLDSGDIDGALGKLSDAAGTIVDITQDARSKATEAQKEAAEEVKKNVDAETERQESMDQAEQEREQEVTEEPEKIDPERFERATEPFEFRGGK